MGLFFPQLKSFAESRYKNLQLFAKVLNLVQIYYVDTVDTKKIIYGGVKGMLRELDPHTNFLPPAMYKEFQSETSGEFGGIGIELTVKKDLLTIISPIEDTPAWKAGIKAGDRITSINGESTKGFTLTEAAQKMKGKKGRHIKLGIYRKGFSEPKIFKIKRGTIKIKSAKYTDLEDGYAYIRLTSFIENSYRDINKIIKKHLKKHKSIKGLILDLRKNPGGLLDQAVKISDKFLNKGVIVSTIGRDKKKKEVQSATQAGTLKDFPIIVLVDEYSASASEIVAGALQDNKRALIMGRKTFGKGSVQSIVRLGDGSGLKLTVARYYTPSGQSIQALGITPDIIVDNLNTDVLNKARRTTKVKREKDMKRHLLSDKEKKEKSGESTAGFWWSSSESKSKNKSAKGRLLSKDYQILQAYNYLKAWKKIKKM